MEADQEHIFANKNMPRDSDRNNTKLTEKRAGKSAGAIIITI